MKSSKRLTADLRKARLDRLPIRGTVVVERERLLLNPVEVLGQMRVQTAAILAVSERLRAILLVDCVEIVERDLELGQVA